ncbi:SLC13 family permease [Glaesserella parasuis]|uniref:SLC13 family permease n=4 Tax=Glaesserella parasuis TaxID=738 RepID=A0AA42EE44_GLAPU|nr:SLC13 family permease [Glaesserella parasuis]MDD2169165.1 SLC13 family permease [Glaesserella parasuis]MDE4015463.1 SLC13 family permease [Glaesserella parasuis]MDG6856339.1 SLC13 family permease [Glaesserella parasuis]MDO9645193.1 SLC13 family permease [Glaesserella parasuis]MDO9665152.1 SLC13 family permease [Glaesserella parasuis]
MFLLFYGTASFRSIIYPNSKKCDVFTLFAICLWVTEAIPPFSVGILIIGFLVLIMGRHDAQNAMKYLQTWSDSVIWLFLGGFFLAEAMKKTALDTLLLKHLLPKFGTDPRYVLWGLMLITALMSMFMSNTATTAMMIATISPIFATLDKKANLSRALLLGIPAAAYIGGMGTIIGSPPNAIAFSTGLIQQSEFRLGGIVIGLLGPALSIIWGWFIIELLY